MPKKPVKKTPVKRTAKKAAPRKTAKKSIKKAAPKKSALGRKTQQAVEYGEKSSVLHDAANPLTVAKAKELIGWEPREVDAKTYHVKDTDGNKIFLRHNLTNRPISKPNIATLKQEILHRRWKFNGETIIIGEKGSVLNGQHSLLALIFSSQEWHADPDKFEGWDTEPTMEKLVVYGVEETDEVINTLDTCRPRSLADVIYRSPYFQDLKPSDRKVVARATEYSVRLLWDRTGAKKNAFAPIRTHSESISFIERHPKLLEAVAFVVEENAGKEKKVARYLSLGYMSAMLYLMGSSATDPQDYFLSLPPREELLDFEHWEKACEFVVELADGNSKFESFRRVFAELLQESGGSVIERTCLLSKAWNLYCTDAQLTTKKLKLNYHVSDGVKQLIDCDTVGGIDFHKDADEIRGADPTPDQIKTRASKLRKDATAPPKKRKSKKPALVPSQKKKGQWSVNDVCWVADFDYGSEHWLGKIIIPPNANGYAFVLDEKGEDWEQHVDTLSLTMPGAK